MEGAQHGGQGGGRCQSKWRLSRDVLKCVGLGFWWVVMGQIVISSMPTGGGLWSPSGVSMNHMASRNLSKHICCFV